VKDLHLSTEKSRRSEPLITRNIRDGRSEDEFVAGLKAVGSTERELYAKLRRIEELLEHIWNGIVLLMFMGLALMIVIAVLR
jgi:hypothetical protein